MTTRPPRSLVILRIVFGYLLIGGLALHLCLSWLAHRTTGPAIGLGLVYMVVLVGALGTGLAVILLESSHVRSAYRHTPAQGAALTGASIIAAASTAASVVITYFLFIADASRGYLAAAANHPLATALWCVALLSFAVWLFLLAVVMRNPDRENSALF